MHTVPRAEAHKNPTHHQFVPGLGYISHGGPPDLPAGATGSKNCAPLAGVKDGSAHFMQPPGGHPPMMMIWLADAGAWRAFHPGKGNRIAWTTDHLSRAGWEYIDPVMPSRKKR